MKKKCVENHWNDLKSIQFDQHEFWTKISNFFVLQQQQKISKIFQMTPALLFKYFLHIPLICIEYILLYNNNMLFMCIYENVIQIKKNHSKPHKLKGGSKNCFCIFLFNLPDYFWLTILFCMLLFVVRLVFVFFFSN